MKLLQGKLENDPYHTKLYNTFIIYKNHFMIFKILLILLSIEYQNKYHACFKVSLKLKKFVKLKFR